MKQSKNITVSSVVLLLTAVFSIAGQPCQADIVHASHSTSTFFAGSTGDGQSFTADASVVNLEHIDFMWQDGNTHQPLPDLTMHLFEGAGFGGTEVDSVSISLASVPADFTFIPFDFSGNTLTPGQVYTFRLVGGPDMRGGFRRQFPGTYAGGMLYYNFGGSNPDQDYAFQIVGTPVPEPASLAIMGLGGLAILLRKRAN